MIRLDKGEREGEGVKKHEEREANANFLSIRRLDWTGSEPTLVLFHCSTSDCDSVLVQAGCQSTFWYSHHLLLDSIPVLVLVRPRLVLMLAS